MVRGGGGGGGGLHQLMIHMAWFFFGGVRVVWFGWELSEVEWNGVMYLGGDRLFVIVMEVGVSRGWPGVGDVLVDVESWLRLCGGVWRKLGRRFVLRFVTVA